MMLLPNYLERHSDSFKRFICLERLFPQTFCLGKCGLMTASLNRELEGFKCVALKGYFSSPVLWAFVAR